MKLIASSNYDLPASQFLELIRVLSPKFCDRQ